MSDVGAVSEAGIRDVADVAPKSCFRRDNDLCGLVGDGGVLRIIKFGVGFRTDEAGEPGVGLVVDDIKAA